LAIVGNSVCSCKQIAQIFSLRNGLWNSKLSHNDWKQLLYISGYQIYLIPKEIQEEYNET
jgi:hypothetical protein